MPNQKNLPITLIFSCILQIACSLAYADTADNVLRYSDSQIMSTAKTMADGVSRASPSQIDAATTLLGAIFSPDTKTIIYKYETSVSIDSSKMHSYLVKLTCSDRIIRALMYRGVKFKHVYLTPTGQEAGLVTYEDCK